MDDRAKTITVAQRASFVPIVLFSSTANIVHQLRAELAQPLPYRFYLKKPTITDTDCCSAAAFPSYVSPLTTTVYTHPSDEEMRNRLLSPRC